MTATQPLETLKAGLQISVGKIKRRLSGRVLFGTVAVLAALFFIGMFPRWRANAALTSSVRDQRPTVGVISSEHPGNDANLVLPGSTQAIQETAQLLAEIETPEVDQELNQARANVTQAIANSDLARATLTRWKDLADKKVVSEQEFDEKKSAADARAADLKVAQANVKRLEELQGFEKIVAPFAGIVTARNIDNGNLVAAGSGQTAPLFRLAQTDTLRIYVTVPQTQARSIVAGQNATVSLREIPDKTFSAKVVRTAGAIDPASRTLLTELQVPNDSGELFPGMYAEVKFALTQDRQTLLVPGNAVMIRSDGPKILVVDAKNVIHARAIKLGRDLGDKVEILSGVDAAEPVVANPTDALRDGAEVKIQTQPSKKSDQQASAKPMEKKS